MKELRIRNWDKWQSYRKDRGQPPWIKIHRELLRNPEWVSLSDAQRGQVVALWLLGADREGALPNDALVLRRLCHMTSTPNIKMFIEKGFLENVTPSGCQADATVTPNRRQDDAPETETDSVANATGADAPPIYTDSRHELWGEGVQILVALGVKNREARSNIGRWLRDSRDDAQRVLGAIQRARDARAIEPIAWITRAISTKDEARGASQGNGFKRALGQLAESVEQDHRSQEIRPPPPRLLSHR